MFCNFDLNLHFFPAVGMKKQISVQEIDLSKGRRIGEGGFGSVYQTKWSNIDVAVKVCLGNVVDGREVQLLSNLPNHPNVIELFGVTLSDDSINTYIVMELAVGGSLHNYLHKNKNAPLFHQSESWALEVAHAMEHLHHHKVIHRDLKSPNVLLTAVNTAKVCDFGLARPLSEAKTWTTVGGTPCWAAPELLFHEIEKISYPCDVYSYGMLTYELFTHKLPYDGRADKLYQGVKLKLPSSLPEYMQSLITNCWKRDPQERPTFTQIINAIKDK